MTLRIDDDRVIERASMAAEATNHRQYIVAIDRVLVVIETELLNLPSSALTDVLDDTRTALVQHRGRSIGWLSRRKNAGHI